MLSLKAKKKGESRKNKTKSLIDVTVSYGIKVFYAPLKLTRTEGRVHRLTVSGKTGCTTKKEKRA